jgi:hypothetical protein
VRYKNGELRREVVAKKKIKKIEGKHKNIDKKPELNKDRQCD